MVVVGAETPYISQRVSGSAQLSRDDNERNFVFLTFFFFFSVDLLEYPLHIKSSPRGLGLGFEVSLEVSTYHSPTLPHPSYLSLSCSIPATGIGSKRVYTIYQICLR